LHAASRAGCASAEPSFTLSKAARPVAVIGKMLEERLGFFAKPKLLIIDKLGYLPFLLRRGRPNAGPR
jgi:hypothetical protein